MFEPGDLVIVSRPWRADSPMGGRKGVVASKLYDKRWIDVDIEGLREELNPVPMFIRELDKLE